MYYLAELVRQSKVKIIKQLETVPLIINEHNFLKGAAPLALAYAVAFDLNIPVNPCMPSRTIQRS